VGDATCRPGSARERAREGSSGTGSEWVKCRDGVTCVSRRRFVEGLGGAPSPCDAVMRGRWWHFDKGPAARPRGWQRRRLVVCVAWGVIGFGLGV